MNQNTDKLKEVAAQILEVAAGLDGGLNIKEATVQLGKAHVALTVAMHRLKPNNTLHSHWKDPALAHDVDRLLKKQLRMEENGERVIIQAGSGDNSYPYTLTVNDKEYGYVVEADRNKDYNLIRTVFSRNSSKYSY